jgi:Raf kinase inhibitor-like YbhB/YbcL family protein
MRLAPAILTLLCHAFTACGGVEEARKPPSPSTSGQATASATSTPPIASEPFALGSPAFADNTQIPAEYSCNGRNTPPPLRWRNPPPGTESLALVVDDPDAVGGLYIHWVVSGIPPTATEIVEGALPGGAVVSLNSGGNATYLGPCPPAGTGVHHYRFQLYALKRLTLAPTTPARDAARTIAGTAIGAVSMVGLFAG